MRLVSVLASLYLFQTFDAFLQGFRLARYTHKQLPHLPSAVLFGRSPIQQKRQVPWTGLWSNSIEKLENSKRYYNPATKSVIIFSGTLIDGLPHGHGKLVTDLQKGSILEGEFQAGRIINGSGTLVEDGLIIHGNWVDGELEGLCGVVFPTINNCVESFVVGNFHKGVLYKPKQPRYGRQSIIYEPTLFDGIYLTYSEYLLAAMQAKEVPCRNVTLDWTQKNKIYRMELHNYTMHLKPWVKKLKPAFYHSDLDVRVNGLPVYDDASLVKATPDTSVIQNLTVKSLSRRFTKYTSLKAVKHYANIQSIRSDSDFNESFASVAHIESFDAQCDNLYTQLLELADVYAEDSYNSQRFDQHIVNLFWTKATYLANTEVQRLASIRKKETSSRIRYAPEVMIRAAYDSPVRGKRAHGKLDMVMFMNYKIYLLLNGASSVIPLDTLVYPALAQLVVVRGNTFSLYKHDAQFRRLPEAQVLDVINEYPSMGVATNAKSWVFLKYQWNKEEDQWCAEQSHVYNLNLSPTWEDYETVKVQVKSLLTALVGAAVMQHQSSVELEGKLYEMKQLKN